LHDGNGSRLIRPVEPRKYQELIMSRLALAIAVVVGVAIVAFDASTSQAAGSFHLRIGSYAVPIGHGGHGCSHYDYHRRGHYGWRYPGHYGWHFGPYPLRHHYVPRYFDFRHGSDYRHWGDHRRHHRGHDYPRWDYYGGRRDYGGFHHRGRHDDDDDDDDHRHRRRHRHDDDDDDD
jgi:hypothetical protein